MDHYHRENNRITMFNFFKRRSNRLPLYLNGEHIGWATPATRGYNIRFKTEYEEMYSSKNMLIVPDKKDGEDVCVAKIMP